MEPIYQYENKITYLSKVKRNQLLIYRIILLMIFVSAASLPFITIDISVKSQGILRPSNEKTELKSSVTTMIDTIYFKEGDTVAKGDIILQLRKENIVIERAMNNFEINQRNQFIQDLSRLTQNADFSVITINSLESPVYKQQTSRFILQLSELNTQLKKVNKELYIDSVLSVDKVIAPKEMFDKQIEHEKLIAAINATKEQQLATWQGELARYLLEKSQYENANLQLNEDSSFYDIKAPVNGVLQNFTGFYAGGLIQAGEAVAVISPQTELIAECYINTTDIGLLKLNQQTLFQVDAFDYNYFGILRGKILSIDNDYSVIDNKPVFKVRCTLDSRHLYLKNGFAAHLKKGMTVQARFVITKRTVSQLLFDKINDWVNPTAPDRII